MFTYRVVAQHPLRKALRHKALPLQAIIVETAIHYGIVGENLKQFGVGIRDHRIERFILVPCQGVIIGGSYPASHFHFRNFGLEVGFVPPRQRKVIFITHSIDAVAVRRGIGDGILLIDVVADQYDEGNGDDEPHRLDGGIKFVAREEFEVTRHDSYRCLLYLKLNCWIFTNLFK